MDFFRSSERPQVAIEQLPIWVQNPSAVSLYLLREDLIPLAVSGNKFRKLRYNYQKLLADDLEHMISFGGAHSNHISALAQLGNTCNVKTVGIIRGEELADKKLNPTLQMATKNGMELHFVSRSDYRLKENSPAIRLIIDNYPNAMVIPEGGTNDLAVKGCEDILGEHTVSYTHICVAVGTGGTLAGMIRASNEGQQLLGFSALKGTFQSEEIKRFTDRTNFELTDEASRGGYAKVDAQLVSFINEFKERTSIQLDPIYTSKMMWGILDRIKAGRFPKNSRILAVHTGGLQGIPAMNQILIKKQLPPIW